MDNYKGTIKQKSMLSVITLVGNSSYSAILGFIAFFILTVKSGAYLLGIYNTVLATLSIFTYFTNLGLAAAIMQKKKVERVDLNTAFYIQFFLSVLGIIIAYVATERVFNYYADLPREAIILYWSILISFFLLSLKTIPSILLEKKIEIYKVVSIQALENTTFYLTIIIMVSMGYTILALVSAVLLRSIVGVVAIYILNPWIPGLQVSFSSAKKLLSYGIPFQGNSLLALVKDDLLVLYLGGTIGLTNLGIIMFGKKYAEFSIRVVGDNINRVAFPLFARYQTNKDMLKKSLSRVFFYETALIFPAIVGAFFVFDLLLKSVPGYYDKWYMSLFAFYVFSLYALCVSIYTPLINFFNAIGRVHVSLFFMLLFTFLQWLFVVVGVRFLGITGIPLAFLAMSLSFVFVVVHSKKYLRYSLFSYIKESIYATFCMMVALLIIRFFAEVFMLSPQLNIVLSVLIGASVYIYVLHLRKGTALLADVRGFFSSFRHIKKNIP